MSRALLIKQGQKERTSEMSKDLKTIERSKEQQSNREEEDAYMAYRLFSLFVGSFC